MKIKSPITDLHANASEQTHNHIGRQTGERSTAGRTDGRRRSEGERPKQRHRGEECVLAEKSCENNRTKTYTGRTENTKKI